jgi:hypothetical protein
MFGRKVGSNRQCRKVYGLEDTKAPTSFDVEAFELDPAASYSSIGRPYSTIGAGGLNGRVRDGIGCNTSAIATGNC